ncbi:hypothetical protein F5Y06DRAFT_279983 [Hypoxylon sp. FL0890]|nr:hypothetical protein F5Y06DRAFT_279983 [Hypoxylon sp. FL0890]
MVNRVCWFRLPTKMKRLFFISMTLCAAKAVVRAADCRGVAQTAIPSCAQPCFVENAGSVGCDGADFACQCQNEATLYAAIESCVASGCPEPSFQAVIDGASSVCNCATANPGAFVTGSSLASFTFVAAATDSGMVIGSVPSTVPASAIVTGTSSGSLINAPTGATTTSRAPTPSAFQSVAPSHQINFRPNLAANVVLAAILSILLF